jgi:putative transposase
MPKRPGIVRASSSGPASRDECEERCCYDGKPHMDLLPDPSHGGVCRTHTSFPIQEDEHFYTVARYVERNALRAYLVGRAKDWRWGSLCRWVRGSGEDKELLAAWPSPRRPNWVDHVNSPQTEAEMQAVRRSVQRCRPFGDAAWTERIAQEMNLESTLRPTGRPKTDRIGS